MLSSLRSSRTVRRIFFLLNISIAVLVARSGPPARAQIRPVYSRGAAGLLQDLLSLETTASALHTGAHPDDEDTAFMARVARGDRARVAYLSLNRGEGGQNVIGPELLESLGVIRTEELLQARTLDGGEQFFTRAYDFGFSKRVEEAADRWGEQQVLADVVRVIRMYRPLVIYSGFSGTPADGHGQHQLAGKLTPVAFKAAGDRAMFPDQLAAGLRPWQAKKLYVRQGFRPDPEHPPTLRLATGVYDPVLGRSYFEIAMEGRSQHKSQEMGVPELRGPQASAMRLLESLVPHPGDETSVFDGLDTSVGGLARLSGLPPGALDTQLAAIVRATKAALAQYDPLDPAKVVQPLAEGLQSVRAARAALPTAAGTDDARADADLLLGVKELQFERALARAAGIVVDPLADAETLAPSETVNVAVRLFLASPALVEVSRVRLLAPTGWLVKEGTPPDTSSSNLFARFFREAPDRSDGFNVTVPADAPYTQPYWLARPRVGDRFEWSDSDPRSLPFDPPLLSARVEALAGGVSITIDHPVTYRLTDRVRGELRRNLDVVPPVVVSLDSQLEIVPRTALGQPRRIAVRLRGETDHEQAGSLRLVVPNGWSVSPTDAPFTMPKKGDRTSVVFTLTPAATAASGRYQVRAEATIDGRRLDRAMRTIAYPHIQTHRMYLPAEAGVRVLDLKVAPVKVGYIMGSGDQVPDAIRRMGLEVTMLDEDQLASSDLSRFDVIVVGIRASEARPDFVGNHGRLLAFVREGGTLIVQYQQIDYAARGLPPFPTEIGSRVTDEEAPVTILVPDHPAFTRPNHIGPSDWSDWVQERNLYAFTKDDPRYVPMLETADPGEPPQRGGQVIASLGRGFYVYTSYAWFRQLPAGVPGAYRLFANLLSLPKTVRAAPPRQP